MTTPTHSPTLDQSPSLTAVVAEIERGRMDNWEARRIVIGFIEQNDECAVTRILCDEIESLKRGNYFCSECERDLREGVIHERHKILECRDWMTPNDYVDVSGMWDDDLRSDQIVATESQNDSDVDESDQDDLSIKWLRTASHGAPSSLAGKSAFDALLVLHGYGVLSKPAMRGAAIEFLEERCDASLKEVLCRHIDIQGRHEEFARFLEKAIASQEYEIPLSEDFLKGMEETLAESRTPEEQARLDRIFDEGMAVHMAEREKCKEYWKCHAEVLRSITATENRYAFIVFHAIRDHIVVNATLETLIRVGVETYCGLEAATELDDEMIEAAHLESHFSLGEFWMTNQQSGPLEAVGHTVAEVDA